MEIHQGEESLQTGLYDPTSVIKLSDVETYDHPTLYVSITLASSQNHVGRFGADFGNQIKHGKFPPAAARILGVAGYLGC